MPKIFWWRPPQIPSSGSSGDPNPAPGMYTIAVRRWLYNKLSQSAALTTALGGTAIYESVVPQGTALPCVVYQVQAPSTEGNATGNAIAGVPLFSVKVVSEGATFNPADAIMQVVLPLLEGASGTVTGFNILGCTRQGDIDYVEHNHGKRYNHLGAVYRVAVVGTA